MSEILSEFMMVDLTEVRLRLLFMLTFKVAKHTNVVLDSLLGIIAHAPDEATLKKGYIALTFALGLLVDDKLGHDFKPRE
jgi:hypothetical protein